MGYYRDELLSFGSLKLKFQIGLPVHKNFGLALPATSSSTLPCPPFERLQAGKVLQWRWSARTIKRNAASAEICDSRCFHSTVGTHAGKSCWPNISQSSRGCLLFASLWIRPAEACVGHLKSLVWALNPGVRIWSTPMIIAHGLRSHTGANTSKLRGQQTQQPFRLSEAGLCADVLKVDILRNAHNCGNFCMGCDLRCWTLGAPNALQSFATATISFLLRVWEWNGELFNKTQRKEESEA